MKRLTQGTIEEVAERLWDEILRTDFDFDFLLGEYTTTEASAEADAEHMLQGGAGEGYRGQVYEALRELHFSEEEIRGMNQAHLTARMQEALVRELKARL